MKGNLLIMTLASAALLAAPNAFAVDAPQSLQDLNMAMEYRADNGDIFTNLKVDPISFRPAGTADNGNPLYALEGMLGWYNKAYLLDPPVAEYDSEEGVLIVLPGQEVIERDGIRWLLYNMEDEENMDGKGIFFRLDNDGIFRHISSGLYRGTRITSFGFGIATEPQLIPDTTEEEILLLYVLGKPSIQPYNGHMEYSFVAQNGMEYAQQSVIYSKVDGLNWIVRNWSDSGFEFDIFFTIDPEAKTVTATNQTCLDDPDMLGECILGEATRDGSPILNSDGKYSLQGTFNVIGGTDGKTMLTDLYFPIWGCFNERGYNFYVPTTNTVVHLNYDILNPESIVGAIAEDMMEAPEEYFDLQGRRVTNPADGLYIRRVGSKSEKIVIK